MKVSVSDTVYLASSERWRASGLRKVVAVARKWATLDDRSRFDMSTGYLDGKGFSSPGTVHESEEAWKASVVADQYWRAFSRKVERSPRPHGVTTDDIVVAASMLGLALTVEAKQ